MCDDVEFYVSLANCGSRVLVKHKAEVIVKEYFCFCFLYLMITES